MDPLKKFDEWFQEATRANEPMPEKIVLASATKSGQPSARFLLLKGREDRRFYFYTNYMSRKSGELDSNPFGALAFFWDKTQKQVRVEGPVARASSAESDAYWKTRPRESQIGAWASNQSSVISSREEIEKKVAEFDKKFQGREVPRPESWGGYYIEAKMIEFWTGREFRVHDREVYEWMGNSWKESRLSP